MISNRKASDKKRILDIVNNYYFNDDIIGERSNANIYIVKYNKTDIQCTLKK